MAKETLPDGRLLVFAHEAEAGAFQDVPHFVTGIGKVSAAVQLAQILATRDVREIIVMGTAGMITDGLDLDTVYRVRRAIQHDLVFGPPVAELAESGFVTMQGSVPGRVATGGVLGGGSAAQSTPARDVAKDGIVEKNVAGSVSGGLLQTAVIATGDVFVTDDAVRDALAGQGASLVDMESYAYASLGASFQVPTRIFKIPSDFADSETTDETWDSIVARKSVQLREFAENTRII